METIETAYANDTRVVWPKDDDPEDTWAPSDVALILDPDNDNNTVLVTQPWPGGFIALHANGENECLPALYDPGDRHNTRAQVFDHPDEIFAAIFGDPE